MTAGIQLSGAPKGTERESLLPDDKSAVLGLV